MGAVLRETAALPRLSESGSATPEVQAAALVFATTERLASTVRVELGRGALAGVVRYPRALGVSAGRSP